MPSDSATALLIIGLVALYAVFLYFFITRSQHLLKIWAQDNGYEIIRSEFRMFRKGPFMLSGRSQTVYRVALRDEAGRTRTAWVRCGGWFSGVFRDQVEAKWDE